MKTVQAILVLTTAISAIFAHEYDSGRPDGHAAISIMGDHTHKKNEWMVSYRFMYMDMAGLRMGDSSISSTEAFANNYTVEPTEMPMTMHMLGVMYAPTDKLTLSAMTHYREAEMTNDIFPNAAPLIMLNGGEAPSKPSHPVLEIPLLEVSTRFVRQVHSVSMPASTSACRPVRSTKKTLSPALAAGSIVAFQRPCNSVLEPWTSCPRLQRFSNSNRALLARKPKLRSALIKTTKATPAATALISRPGVAMSLRSQQE